MGVSNNSGVSYIDPIPSGGSTNQVLSKASNADYDLKWANGGGGGGATIPSVTNLIKGDGAGNGADSGIGITGGGGPAVGTLTYTPANDLGHAASSTNGYNQIIIQNKSNAAAASSDLVVNNDQSTDSTFYGDFGMNGSGFSGTGSLSAANNVYLTATSSDLVIGTTTSNAIRFVVNGGATDAMSISSAGIPTFANTIVGSIAIKGSVGGVFDGGGSAVTNGSTAYVTCPYAGTITGYSILVDTGTCTVKTWKIATGTAIPTVANSISTNGVAISSGTAIRSTTVSDFTSTAITANDILAFNITAISGATKIIFQLEVTRT